MSSNDPIKQPTPDWRDLRRQERSQRHAERSARHGDRAWLTGPLLILLGLVLLAQNLGAFSLHNWWALFVLIPAIGSFGTAWGIYTRAGGTYTPALIGPLVGGVILLAVTATLLLELNWGLIGPILLILAGLGALVGGVAWRR